MELISLAILGILIVISPGADFVLVLKNSINLGRRAGILTAVGISLAIGVHISYSMLGISYLISQNEALFHAIRYLGAGYLIYLGLKGIFAKEQASPDINQTEKTKQRYIAQGFFCNVLNPKTMLFFLSIFSQLITNNPTDNAFALGYGVYMMALHMAWFALVAILFTSPLLQGWLNRFKQRLNQVCGAGLVLFGSALALKS
ncbi:LysE family translocator [Vibrio sp. D404a]|uniref:LysE family translocator n=1 Tax=unclassified Vibrio TaxID=2614977 RepID=UPI002557B798|nr:MULTISPECIES: LysE family translocator [unclassified Vibrio]MDK9738469.1 LysE family translocator [Vibrio sp. D404a]MDK9796167.1 LysE family translocator [Vibrio sp. D449a]